MRGVFILIFFSADKSNLILLPYLLMSRNKKGNQQPPVEVYNKH